MEVTTLNAFAETEDGGNPAGVVFEAQDLSEDMMQQIAKKVGFSETAFISKSDKADFKLRFFTPESEVDLCGHATIASFYAMFDKGLVKPGKYMQETKAGILQIEIREDGKIFMEQNKPAFFEKLTEKDEDFFKICESIGIKSDKIGIKNYVAQLDEEGLSTVYIEGKNVMRKMGVVSTGIRDMIIPVEGLETLRNIKPNYELITELSRKYDITGYHVFTLETEDEENTAQCRNFAPLFGIDEESATGTSNGALACFLYENNLKSKIKLNGTINMKFEQGYTMNKKSMIEASIDVHSNDKGVYIEAVRVGGKAKGISKLIVEI
ncbi:MAG: PhzF family phenazine biosynthesis protein [Proteocatella sp.]